MTFKVNDLVRIIKQPSNQLEGLVGKVGLVTFVDNEFVYLTAFTLQGVTEGAGAVPASCLEPVTDEAWQQAKTFYEVTLSNILSEVENFEIRFKNKIDELAEQYNIDPVDLEEIFMELDRFYQDSMIDINNAHLPKIPSKDQLN